MTDFRIIELQNPTDCCVVMGGVKWKTLIGLDKAKQSIRIAKDDKASHYLPADQYSHMVGTIHLPAEYKTKGNDQKAKGVSAKASNVKRKRRLYSAAAVFAQIHTTGAHLVKLQLEDGLWWVVAVHEAVIVKGTDVLCTDVEADNLVKGFLRANPNAVIVAELGDIRPYLNVHTELVEAKSASQSVPNSVKLLVLGAIAIFALNAAWDEWQKRQRAAARTVQQTLVVDSRAEWGKALDKWANGIELDGPTGLTAVYGLLSEIPMDVGGWTLLSGECVSKPKVWHCSATYKSGPFADNRSFNQSMPEGWSANWVGLDLAAGTWEAVAARTVLVRSRLIEVKDFNLNYISALQRVLPAFRQVDLKPAVEITLQPPVFSPKGNGEMVKVPYPADNKGIELPKTQLLTLTGPLRSIAVLPLAETMSITSVKFDVEGRGVRPDLRTSVITANLVGVIYVK
ncbi:type 4b pilus protein PilO2 [Pseudomonas syringae]|uniref:type 4b pilus protein PilO2 n=1 Tax=Pseudomonas syringae TaxID=317 RepID=UPI0024609AD8|nr:type 4b pilus protein PilO2 [Pseudomonas syringae]MDH4602343.1 type 4b pilus protein PilO2 [Pseudomonas syringae pv. papulans]